MLRGWPSSGRHELTLVVRESDLKHRKLVSNGYCRGDNAGQGRGLVFRREAGPSEDDGADVAQALMAISKLRWAAA